MEFSEPEISQNRGVKPSGGIITPLRIPPPVHQRVGGGGVITAHTPRPAFAIAKIDFPETFDRRPEFAPGGVSNRYLPAPPPIVGGL
jgi:hypothetical protein